MYRVSQIFLQYMALTTTSVAPTPYPGHKATCRRRFHPSEPPRARSRESTIRERARGTIAVRRALLDLGDEGPPQPALCVPHAGHAAPTWTFSQGDDELRQPTHADVQGENSGDRVGSRAVPIQQPGPRRVSRVL